MSKFEIGDIVYGLPNASDKYVYTTIKAKMMVVESVYLRTIKEVDEDDIFVVILEQFEYPEKVGNIYKVESEFFTKDVPLEFTKKEVLSTIDNNVTKCVQEDFSKKVHEVLLQILSREKY